MELLLLLLLTDAFSAYAAHTIKLQSSSSRRGTNGPSFRDRLASPQAVNEPLTDYFNGTDLQYGLIDS